MNTKKTIIASSLFLAVVLLTSYLVSKPNHFGDTVTSVGAGNAETITSAKATNQRLLDDALNHKIVKIHSDNVPSLAGIEHETNILTDSEGNLRVDESLKELFEFYLSSIGEEPFEQVLQRIQSELDSQLKSPALEQALSLLKRYVDYKIELVSIDQEAPSPLVHSNSAIENIKHQKSQLSALRSSYFDPVEYQQFFEQEELYDNYMISRIEITRDQALDEETKRQNIDALEQTLPEEIRSVRKKVSLHGNLYARAEKMKSEGFSNEAVFQIREESLGTEAAEALAKLDDDRAQWQKRLTGYKQQRDAIIDSGLSQADQLRAINNIIDVNFSGTERLRVRALNSSL
ncbi:lipase secretion chaperone [Alkalimarinus alittae]|uniref:Lipase chaperone n=1 Tax=Alkalimarinus alittae TaxID=2961619 RepID=A0ABY6MXE8_9ALTE|nr:lipase secretion chaperone [Alkalimarinus alittae]UZE94496.1 hypothetical protein NKI27_10380 [Alkalimarinus alittae]